MELRSPSLRDVFQEFFKVQEDIPMILASKSWTLHWLSDNHVVSTLLYMRPNIKQMKSDIFKSIFDFTSEKKIIYSWHKSCINNFLFTSLKYMQRNCYHQQRTTLMVTDPNLWMSGNSAPILVWPKIPDQCQISLMDDQTSGICRNDPHNCHVVNTMSLL